jgi:hypothetical protein
VTVRDLGTLTEGVDAMYSVFYWSVVALLAAWIFLVVFAVVKGF